MGQAFAVVHSGHERSPAWRHAHLQKGRVVGAGAARSEQSDVFGTSLPMQFFIQQEAIKQSPECENSGEASPIAGASLGG